MATKFAFPGVKEIAAAYVTLAQIYIKGGSPNWKKPPYKTGNLYRRIASYNTAAKMATMRPVKSQTKVELSNLTLSLNFAPPGAEYGKWVEWGNGTHVGAGNPRPFAQYAANDKRLKKAVDAAIKGDKGPIKALLNDFKEELDDIFKKK